jgi:acyl-CoA thioester hydrolase
VRRLALDPPLDPAAYRHTHDVRARFAETDAMGVVHHAAYFVWLEEARIAFLRSTGRPYETVRAEGLELAVLEAFAAYRKPLRFDEVVRIHMRFGELTTATFQIAYLLTVEGEARATAVTVHGCISPSGVPTRVPPWLRALAAPAGA